MLLGPQPLHCMRTWAFFLFKSSILLIWGAIAEATELKDRSLSKYMLDEQLDVDN